MTHGLLYLRIDHDDNGRPVLQIACDCAIVTDYTLDIATSGEFAATCDGCQTTRWFALDAPADQQGAEKP